LVHISKTKLILNFYFCLKRNKYDIEAIQQVKRLRLISITKSPLNDSFNLKQDQKSLSYSNVLSQAASAAGSALCCSSSKIKKSLTSKLIELDDDFNSLDSGFSQTQQSQSDELFRLNDSSDSDFDEEKELESEQDASFQIKKVALNAAAGGGCKLLDISNCSAQSNSSINSPFQARRCLFKQSSDSNTKTKPKMQITPISISRHNSIIPNTLNEPENEFEQDHEFIKKMLDLEHKSTNTGLLRTSCTSFANEDDLIEQRRLIGDRSSYHILPCKTNIKHNDLNVITAGTLTRVMDGEFNSEIDKLIIIDSRYPYEYDAGHIRTAQNVYTKEGLMQMFLNKNSPLMQNKENQNTKNEGRLVVVFHCEFSSERGPGLLRFLRSQDRLMNKDSYPKLFYPELYLLEGGYKSFYEQHSQLCEPQFYKPMLHKDHLNDLKHFRAKTKTWEAQHKYLTNLNCCSSMSKNASNADAQRRSALSSRLQRFPRSTLF